MRLAQSLRSIARLEAMEMRRLLSTVVVNTLLDETVVNSTTSLREAIQSAAAGDTIQFASGLSGQIALNAGELLIAKNVSIVGPGSTVLSINGKDAARVLEVGANANVVISGVTLTHGRAVRGGGISNAGSLTLKNVTLTANAARGPDGDLNDGGAGEGGAVYNSGVLVVSSSQIIGNTATGGAGQLGVTQGNAGGGSGGGIFNAASGAVTLTSTVLQGNSAVGGTAQGMPGSAGGGDGGAASGGAIHSDGAIQLVNCTVTNNIARGSDGGGGDFAAGFGGAASGGAIDSSASVQITGTTFSGNSAIAGAGGQVFSMGLFVPGGLASGGAVDTSAQGSLKIASSTFNSNYILGGNEQLVRGGAIASGGSLQMSKTTIAGNSAKANQDALKHLGQPGGSALGGGIWIGGAGGTINTSTFEDNRVLGGPGGTGYNLHGSEHSSAPGGYGYGGAIYLDSAVVISNSTIAKNTATGGKGGDADFVTQSSGATGGDGGGAGVYVAGSAKLSLRSATIAGNVAVGGKGGAAGLDNPGGLPLPAGANGLATGGGVFAGGLTDLGNTIVAGNQAPQAGPDVLGAIASLGFNLIGSKADSSGWITTDLTGTAASPLNAKLGPMANNGGATRTMLPLSGSPVIDRGKAFGLAIDQRGFPRPYDLPGVVSPVGSDASDIGAVEVQPYPFSGNPIDIPFKAAVVIQAENFDNGGEGIAWHDVDAANLGGAYRTTSVDLQPTTDAGGGHNIGWARAGEWLDYTVNVVQTGTYNLGFRVASNGVGGKFHLEVDGQDVTGALAVPNTFGWQSFKTIEKRGVYLASGRHVLRLVMDSVGPGGAVGNFNYLTVGTDSVNYVVKSSASAFVRDGVYAGTNYGQDSQLLIKKWQNSYNREAFVQFDLSSVGAVSSAKLRLFGNLQDANVSAIQVGVFESPVNWTELGITWANRPAAGAQLASFTVSGTTARWYEIDLTTFVKAQKAAGRQLAAIALKGLTSTMTVTSFGSDETPTGPQLVVAH